MEMSDAERRRNPLINWKGGYDDKGFCMPDKDPYLEYRGKPVIMTGPLGRFAGIYNGLDSFGCFVLNPSIVPVEKLKGKKGYSLRLETELPSKVDMDIVKITHPITMKDLENIVKNSDKKRKKDKKESK